MAKGVCIHVTKDGDSSSFDGRKINNIMFYSITTVIDSSRHHCAPPLTDFSFSPALPPVHSGFRVPSFIPLSHATPARHRRPASGIGLRLSFDRIHGMMWFSAIRRKSLSAGCTDAKWDVKGGGSERVMLKPGVDIPIKGETLRLEVLSYSSQRSRKTKRTRKPDLCNAGRWAASLIIGWETQLWQRKRRWDDRDRDNSPHTRHTRSPSKPRNNHCS